MEKDRIPTKEDCKLFAVLLSTNVLELLFTKWHPIPNPFLIKAESRKFSVPPRGGLLVRQ